MDEERCGKILGVVERERGLPSALGTGHGLADSVGKTLETLDAVVVETWQDLRLAVVLVADGASDLLLHFLERLREVGNFSHGVCVPRGS